MAKLSKSKKIRRLLFLLIVLGLLIYGIVTIVGVVLKSADDETSDSAPLTDQTLKFNELAIGNANYVRFRDVVKQFSLQANARYDEPEGTVIIKHNNTTCEMMVGQTQLAKNGIFLPVDAMPYVDPNSGEISLNHAALQHCLGVVADEGKFVLQTKPASVQPESVFNEQKQIEIANVDASQLTEYMTFLDNPIPGAQLSTRDNHLPGAPRTYRNGTHEGIDFYNDYTNVSIDRNTRVLSVADGVVVRVDREYKEMSVKQRNRLLAIAADAKQTPAYILDKMRGRSVWVQYEKGIMVRYCHMGELNPALRIGFELKRGEWIGNVGNSGTDEGASGGDGELHLHMDVLLYGELFWEHLSKNEIRSLLAKIF